MKIQLQITNTNAKVKGTCTGVVVLITSIIKKARFYFVHVGR